MGGRFEECIAGVILILLEVEVDVDGLALEE